MERGHQRDALTRSHLRVWVVAALALAAPRLAWADGWYIKWDCVGQCDGYGNGSSGILGPYGNEDDCEWVQHNTLPIPYDSLFRHYCEYVGDPPVSGDSYTGYVPPPSSGTSNEIRYTAMEMGLLAGPGWAARDDLSTYAGQGTLGVEVEAHTGHDFGGGALQLGLQGTRIQAPLLGTEPRSWFIAPAGLGLVLTPRLFSWDDNSFWLDAGALVNGYLEFGCEGCAGSAFSKDFGLGYTLRAGFDVMLSQASGVGVDLVVPHYRLGNAAPGDLALDSPRWLVRLSIVSRDPNTFP